MLRLVYNTLIYLAAPIAFAVQVWKGLRNSAYRERLGERFGYTAMRSDRSVWVHAVSVGEVQAAAALIRALAKRYADRELIVTTGTPTGAERVRALFGSAVRHVYLPYDTPGAVRRFLDRIRPQVAIVMETEVWPNLFRECGHRRIPLVIASARLSETSVRRYRWLAGLFRDALAHDIEIAAQTQRDAERFISVGSNPARTHVVGNVKFDLEIDATTRERGRALRAALFPNRDVWVAGSTHAGEEELVLEAHARLRRQQPNALLLLAPRHPQRFDQVKALLASRSVEFVTRSSNAALAPTTSVLLIDTLGELLMFYCAADVAFVGGSLVPIGGHNLLEPAALALPILTGPHNFNAPEVARALFDCGGAVEVRSSDELATAVESFFADVAERTRIGNAAYECVAKNRGALDRLLDVIARRMVDS